ncbi:MAG: hypothetical protein RJB66_493 [Pseudomonadota bacterium]|jgi:hypothetical protein
MLSRRVVVAVSGLLFCTLVLAEEVGTSHPATSQQNIKLTELPRCLDQKQISEVKISIQVNKNSKEKYKKIQEALNSDSDDELKARLIYAETLAANCPDENDKLANAISLVIENRVRRRGNVKSVVFQKDQFASSLNTYSESRINDFLCPQDEKLWNAIFRKVSSSSLASSTSEASDAKYIMHYFLYHHSPRFKKEPWKMNEFVLSAGSPSARCLRLFVNRDWK